ncbi:MAG: DUF1987 domain-containing protein [Chlorobi bacterium]|nr:DUF1987 domain-containing protein [Chlorobiota bacterium]
MKVIKLNNTMTTPMVHLDAEKNIFQIIGASIPENANHFYDPILDWIEEYGKKANKKTVFDLNYKYFNTSSSKLILDLLLILKKIYDAGNDVLVRWHYEESDEDMKESGEDYQDIIKIPFEFVEFEDED